MKKPFFCYLAVTFAVLLGSAADAQTIITSLPYTITASGTYVLNSNLGSSQTSGALISINASNVTIDFQGHYISGPAGTANQPPSPLFGVSSGERSNLTIKNGTIAYCSTGIQIQGNGSATTNSVNHQIDNMRVTYCNFMGIAVDNSPGTRITNCQVSQTGSTNTLGTYAIIIQGAGVVVQNNVVSTVVGASGGAYGIQLDTGSFARQNTISNAYFGVYQGKYQDNLTSGCTMPYSGDTDAGGNN